MAPRSWPGLSCQEPSIESAKQYLAACGVAIGGGYGLRMAFQTLLKFLPVVGGPASALIASSGAYLSDLAVDAKYQRQGIGRELIRRTHEAAGLHTSPILLAAPKAQSYYPPIGMTKHESCWVVGRPARPE